MKKLVFEMSFDQSSSNNNDFVKRLKRDLREMAKGIYEGMGEDLPLSEVDYRTHYQQLGKVLYKIDCINSFKEFMLKAINGEFEEILDVDDEEGFQDFISKI